MSQRPLWLKSVPFHLKQASADFSGGPSILLSNVGSKGAARRSAWLPEGSVACSGPAVPAASQRCRTQSPRCCSRHPPLFQSNAAWLAASQVQNKTCGRRLVPGSLRCWVAADCRVPLVGLITEGRKQTSSAQRQETRSTWAAREPS